MKNKILWRSQSSVNLDLFFSLVFPILLILQNAQACDKKFEGFGVFIGSNAHFSRSAPGIEAKVLDSVYNYLGIRLFRTSYEEFFSPEPDKYEIKCTQNSTFSCAWIKAHRYLSTLPDVKVFASIWSPPHYMKNNFSQLKTEYEPAYYHFIKNITQIIKEEYKINIEKVSPVNEPENAFATWDHTNMSPLQLCRIIRKYNDPLISLCPENSYFWVSKLYYNFLSLDPNLNCWQYCDIEATHAYALNITSLLAYYDLIPQPQRGTTNPIWMTEVSSTYLNAKDNQMQEALDLSSNILNFVGKTCVQRYYFWYAYTLGASGESLIWGNADGTLFYPKKFFAYKLFTEASNNEIIANDGPVEVHNCDFGSNLGCIQFGEGNRVLVNKDKDAKQFNIEGNDGDECMKLCCTTEDKDYLCTDEETKLNVIPAKAICHCVLKPIWSKRLQ